MKIIPNKQPLEDASSLASPNQVRLEIPVTDTLLQFVQKSQETIWKILSRTDDRLLAIVGPCSIHDVDQALLYAKRLKQLAVDVSSEVFIVFRGYVEKPRTVVGWKGLVNDPDLDSSEDLHKGVRMSRRLFLELNRIGLPVATEALSPYIVPYLEDLVSWTAIGARTSESQTHRELASGLSSVVGIKNNTFGNVDVAIDSVQSISRPHRYIGLSDDGQACLRQTPGNPRAHVVLRGGQNGTNYHEQAVKDCVSKLTSRGLPNAVVVDCSHANSNKDFRNQARVVNQVAAQIERGNGSIKGLMLESNLIAGQQQLTDRKLLKFGVSITDGCIGWEQTDTLVRQLAAVVRRRSDRQLATEPTRQVVNN